MTRAIARLDILYFVYSYSLYYFLDVGMRLCTFREIENVDRGQTVLCRQFNLKYIWYYFLEYFILFSRIFGIILKKIACHLVHNT
jgi:hypothetical protein